MEEYVYIKVKLYLKEGQTEDTVQEIIQDVDYSFVHDEVTGTEIIDIHDMQIGGSDE